MNAGNMSFPDMIFKALSSGALSSFCNACCVAMLLTHNTMVVPYTASGTTPSSQLLSRGDSVGFCLSRRSVSDHIRVACPAGPRRSSDIVTSFRYVCRCAPQRMRYGSYNKYNNNRIYVLHFSQVIHSLACCVASIVNNIHVICG